MFHPLKSQMASMWLLVDALLALRERHWTPLAAKSAEVFFICKTLQTVRTQRLTHCPVICHAGKCHDVLHGHERSLTSSWSRRGVHSLGSTIPRRDSALFTTSLSLGYPSD